MSINSGIRYWYHRESHADLALNFLLTGWIPHTRISGGSAAFNFATVSSRNVIFSDSRFNIACTPLSVLAAAIKEFFFGADEFSSEMAPTSKSLVRISPSIVLCGGLYCIP